MTTIHPIRAFKDNYIWMLSNTGEDAFIVDPGEAEPVINTLKIQQKKLAGILITHHHADHTGGIADLIEWAGKVPIYGSHLSKNQFITHPVKENDKINCGTIAFQIFEIPGHTLDHIAFYNDTILFSGDTLFSAGCGRVFEGTHQQMLNSLNKILTLPDTINIYCGHEYTLANLLFATTVEPANNFIKDKIEKVKALRDREMCTLPSTLLDEKQMNPFLRCDNLDVIESVENHCEKNLKTPVEVFTELREWKNQFVS